MRIVRRGVDRASSDDVPHPVVLRDAPVDRHPLRRHAAAVQRIRREPCPEHDAVGHRIAGRDAERERGGLKPRAAEREPTEVGRRDGERKAALGRRSAKREGGSQERTAGEHGELHYLIAAVRASRFTVLGSCSRFRVRSKFVVRSSRRSDEAANRGILPIAYMTEQRNGCDIRWQRWCFSDRLPQLRTDRCRSEV